MGGIAFQISHASFKRFQKRLERVAAKLDDRKKVHQWALAEVDKWTKDNFRTEGGKVGGWPALSTKEPEGGGMSYAEKKKRMGKEKILHITGWLRMKWRIRATRKGGTYTSLDTEHKEKKNIKGQNLEYAGGMSYGAAHNNPKPSSPLPKRQIIPTQKQAGPLITRAYRIWLRKALKK